MSVGRWPTDQSWAVKAIDRDRTGARAGSMSVKTHGMDAKLTELFRRIHCHAIDFVHLIGTARAYVAARRRLNQF